MGNKEHHLGVKIGCWFLMRGHRADFHQFRQLNIFFRYFYFLGSDQDFHREAHRGAHHEAEPQINSREVCER